MHTQSDSSSEAERSQLRLLARYLWGTSNTVRPAPGQVDRGEGRHTHRPWR